ncbi:ComEA family DNA-binding protein [Micromonospora matsumotoense]|uniref:ComEA family DNA-binding protein n=1 Tax=Micromonospora matsumotoense TaxID=121616 RepID=UPI001FDF655B|nr:ComEA family DNA-binding protein [Micromonospora matsumotoense]
MSEDEETRVRRRLYRLTDGVSAGPPLSPPRPYGPVGLRVPPGDGVGGASARRRSGPAADTSPRDAGPAGGPLKVGPSDADWARHTEVDDPVRDGGSVRSADLDRAHHAAGDDGISAGRLPGPGVFDPGRRGVRALAAVAVVVVLGAGFWAWRSRPQAQPVPAATAVAGPESSAGAASGPAPKPTGDLVVAVAGKVRRPGLVRVPAGARVADAVEAAGGALPGVDVALLNPARKLTDGELILVGVTAPPGGTGPDGAAAGPAAAPPGGVPSGRVNLNTATLAQLDALPGVGPVLAQRILTHRDQQGGFRSVGDLRQVDGIGDARYEQLKDLVTV